jgi:twinkle protein
MSNDSASLNRMLLDQFEGVLMHLLPNGKRVGNEWKVGGLDGSAGDSTQVTMTGAAAGRFKDFANPENKGATPLWLWSKVRNVSFSDAVKEAKEFLGVKDEDFGIKKGRPKTYAKPEKSGITLAKTNSPVMDYLTGERRIDPIVIASSMVSETVDGLAICFPFLEKDENGKFVNVHRKYLGLERPEGKKISWSSKGTKRCLYGKNLIDDNVSEITICEGEIDALSWHSWKIPAVSVPNGVADFEWVDVDWDWLARFERINVSMDMDDPGKACALEICKRLGLHRCFIVTIPKKDANECLTSGVTRDVMLKCLADAKAIELDEIKRPDDFRKEVTDYYEADPATVGYSTPWSDTLGWRVRPAELTVWSGFSGHGKTAGLNQLMLHLLSQGAKVMDASLEIKSGRTLYNMTRCALGRKFSPKEEVEACISWIDESLLFLDCIGTVSIDRLMHAMEYARKRHGIEVFIIDSLFMCGISGEDHAAQREFANRLTAFCNNTGAHVILVAHSRKTSNGNELNPPSKSDVAGSSDITNAAFNVIIFFRNKMKKIKLDEAKQANDIEEIDKWMDQPDGRIIVDKQRFGEGEEASIHVYFDKESCQYHGIQNKMIPFFVFKP